MNAFERDGEVVVDISVFDDATIIEDLYLERLRAGKPVGRAGGAPLPDRPGDGTITWERAADEGFDLPRINYGRCNERPYRYAWGIGWGGAGWLERIVKADMETGETKVWSEHGAYPGEPVFVAAPDAEDEDDGVLLSIVLDGERGTLVSARPRRRDAGERARAGVRSGSRSASTGSSHAPDCHAG